MMKHFSGIIPIFESRTYNSNDKEKLYRYYLVK